MHQKTYPNLREIAENCGVAELPDLKGFQAANLAQAVEVAKPLGAKLKLPFKDRPIRLWPASDGKLVAEVARRDADETPPGWYRQGTPKTWRKVFPVLCDQRPEAEKLAEIDAIVRCVCNSGQNGDGTFYIVTDADGKWARYADVRKVRAYLHTHKVPDIDAWLGLAIRHRWELIDLPFGVEWPGGRKWNRDGAQLRHKPIEGSHPTWDKLFHQIGRGLTPALLNNDWAQKYKVDGPKYILYFVANIVQFPFARLPFLALYSPKQDSGGKSTFWESLRDHLFFSPTGKDVVAHAELALKQDFNGGIADAILCVIEEADVSGQSSLAYQKVKDWTTARSMSIRRMRTDSYEQPNISHWLQCCNDPRFVPVLTGDTRVTLVEVPDLEEKIPPGVLKEKLEAEAPAFTWTLLNTQLPPPCGRLQIPAIETDVKMSVIHDADPLAKFVSERCELSGEVPKAVLYDAWVAWCEDEGRTPGKLNAFARTLMSSFEVDSSKPRDGRDRIPTFEGVSLKPDSSLDRGITSCRGSP